MWGEWCKHFYYPSIFILFFKIKNKKDSVWQLCSLWIILARESNWGFLVARFCLQFRGPRFNSWVRKIPWRREWQPTPVFLPEEFHGERSLKGSHGQRSKESDMTEWLKLSLSSKRATKIFRKLPKLIYMTTFLTAVSKNVYDEISLLWSLITCHISGWKAYVSWTICCRLGHNWVTDTFRFSSHYI